MTAGQAGPGCPPDQRRKRGAIDGWSQAAVRRHTRWLYSIDVEGLATDPAAGRNSPNGALLSTASGEQAHLVGLSFTLTLLECPESPEAWESLRRAWIKAVQRLGAVRIHWVVEWQARKVPHLHCAIYFPAGTDPARMAVEVGAAWLARAGRYGAKPQGQDWNVIDGPLGWLQYLSKHAARGVKHYQRQGKPEGWTKTGRLWGHVGDWPEIEPLREEVSWPEFWRLRRLIRSWRIADARAALRVADTPDRARAARRRIRYARRMLQSSDPNLSRVRGVSEWVPVEQLERLLRALED